MCVETTLNILFIVVCVKVVQLIDQASEGKTRGDKG